jgi:hypothetical protein
MSVKTYNSRQVAIVLGTHAVSGLADDSFITIEQKGDGVTSKTGCDGEVTRAIDPNEQYTVKLVVSQLSDTNKYLQSMYAKDKKSGDGTFPILVKDLKGGVKFSASDAWVLKQPSRAWGKDTNNREWNIETGPADYAEN